MNILISFLSKLNVKYTKWYASKFYEEHPYKNNMYGLSKMLQHYNVEHIGVRIADKDEMKLLHVPFIAEVSRDLTTVYKITDNHAHCWKNNKLLYVPIENFKNLWSGAVLLANINEQSIEPNYVNNKRFELFLSARIWVLSVMVATFAAIFYIKNNVYTDIWNSLLLILNIAGAYVGWLLIQKQTDIQSNYINKICSLFKKSDCNSILESNASKLFGLLGWSEIGLCYFISNIIILIFYSHLSYLSSIYNLCVLPYGLWSVWYQKYRAKQWCPLCIATQIIIWGIFLFNLAGHKVIFLMPPLIDLLLSICIYTILLCMISLFTCIITNSNKWVKITQEMNSIKFDENVYNNLLVQEPLYPVDKTTSKILLGNTHADTLITILSNPHCNPCAKLHPQVDHLLSQIGNNVCIQYIFSYFKYPIESHLELSSKFLISVYFNRIDYQKIYHEWYLRGRFDRHHFLKKYNIDTEVDEVGNEFNKHQQWIEENALSSTPVILINGHRLPSKYKIEDLITLYE